MTKEVREMLGNEILEDSVVTARADKWEKGLAVLDTVALLAMDTTASSIGAASAIIVAPTKGPLGKGLSLVAGSFGAPMIAAPLIDKAKDNLVRSTAASLIRNDQIRGEVFRRMNEKKEITEHVMRYGFIPPKPLEEG